MDQAATLPVSDGPSGRLYPGRPLLAVSLAVFRDDKVLLAQRALPPMAGRFSLPGGLVEPGESLAAAACRELREEVAVEARVLTFNRHVELIECDDEGGVARHYVIASFVGMWVAGEGTAGPEAMAVVWADRSEIARLPTTEHLPPLLDKAWVLLAEGRLPC